MSNIHHILKKHWGHSSFRPLQEDIIRAVLDGKDVLALLPTGGGKSVCFQVPALAMEGICLVVSPLIALMKDQVAQLKSKGISAAAIYSGMHAQEIDVLLDNCAYGDIQFLYVSPERLGTDLFKERVKKMKVCLLAIDEAHCISQWGHEFRPSYLDIKEVKAFTGDVPTIALTASANLKVREDIIAQLGLQEVSTFVKSFARANLSYSCFLEENKEARLLSVLKNVKGSGIVYVNTRNKTVEIAKLLRRNGVSVDFYHGGLSNEERNTKQEKWIAGKIRVIVTTNAFGMGIDKPDVRSVVHWEPPFSLEAYYQEAGRAGRDEKKAYAVLLYNNEDLELVAKQVVEHYPDITFIKRVYQSLANYYKMAIGGSKMISYDFELNDFASTFNLNKRETYHALKRLESEGYIVLTDSFHEPSRLRFNVSSQDLYKIQVAKPPYDYMIKGILRIYGGEVLSQFVKFSEKELLKYLRDETSTELTKKLTYLHKTGVASYYPQKTKPQITFLLGRVDANELLLDRKRWDQLKETESTKMKEMINYIKSERCRSLTIQYYFDEKSERSCGVCDRCLAQKKLKVSEEQEIAWKQKIWNTLNHHQKVSLEELIAIFPTQQRKHGVYMIQQLLDQKIIAYDEHKNIQLVRL